MVENNVCLCIGGRPKCSLKPRWLYTNTLPYKCAQTDRDCGNVLTKAELSLLPWRKEKRRRALPTTSKAQRSPPWSLSQWWPPATDHKMNTVLIQFPRGSVGMVGIAHAYNPASLCIQRHIHSDSIAKRLFSDRVFNAWAPLGSSTF